MSASVKSPQGTLMLKKMSKLAHRLHYVLHTKLPFRANKMNLDKVFGFHAQALKLRADRSEIIANNLANVDTPGFKARDLDFKAAMSEYTKQPANKLTQSDERHFSLGDNMALTNLGFRPSLEASLDGNTVDKEVETVAYAKNAFDYQTSLTFLNGSIKTVRKAIKGE